MTLSDEIPGLNNKYWSRYEDIQDLKSKLCDGAFAPTPARLSRRWTRVDWVDLTQLLASYNAWVRLWNVHETSIDLPLSPEWWDGKIPASVGSILELVLNDGRIVEVKLRGWFHFYDGMSFCRNEARVTDVMWARQRLTR
ncbi:hypothetical protein GCM10007913_33830 [Devosia yakushimensis]|uniref:Uncharacterized protein n=1 Tax=Devosia yakushimensis TaxID=470028 RepID=A0ABQ5UJ10_9HYPH|nr:hypothetical protein [Devosia yakushimensis]GLQ11451.1 hypothetical protein GCM10007913_33830 [Devosia yakushimensis]